MPATMLPVLIVFAACLSPTLASSPFDQQGPGSASLITLGQGLFFDKDLSFNRTQSCASCHQPEHAFTDSRSNQYSFAASIGADGKSLGDRHAPSLSYVGLIPPLQETGGIFSGGHFWDGRARNLEEQASQPLFNSIEMALADETALRDRLLEKDAYAGAFRQLFSDDIFEKANSEPGVLSQAFSQAIVAFLRTEYFSPFDSRYDRYLLGEYMPTTQEYIGMALFFSKDFTNCSHCHQLNSLPSAKGETFSNYQYENIGIPVNAVLRQQNNKGDDYVDTGFMEQGRFKVPTLRNVAVTAPYMHNGIFTELRTVLMFYNKYNTTGEDSEINPETGGPWGSPEVSGHLDMFKLNSGVPLSNLHMNALEAFLKMLTDRRYEHLLPKKK